MSQSWRIPDVPEYKHVEPPSIWIAVVAFVVVLVAGFILTIAKWKQGESIISGKFFGFATGIPLLVWGAFCGFLYMSSEDWNNRVDWWNFLCKDNFNDWRAWAQWNLSILDTVTITPEVELAERMLGLEGSAPANAGKVLSLQAGADTVVATRLEDIMNQLITPLAGTLQRFAGKRTVHIALQSTQETHLGVLRGVLQRLDVPHERIAMTRFESKELNGVIDEWISNQTVRYEYGQRQKMMPDLCLLLACQLNDGDASPLRSEAAVALLFGSSQMLKDAKLKPKARLFRPIPTATDDLADALKTLTIAEPTSIKRLRNLWVSNLAKRDGHVVKAISKDSEPALTLLDLDQALGVSGPASPLLLQALAAQTVQYGQGPQLVAMPAADGLRLNLVANEYAPVASVKEPQLEFWEGSICTVLACVMCLLEILAIALDAGVVWAISPIGCGILMLVVGLPAGAIFKRRNVSRDFHERARSRG